MLFDFLFKNKFSLIFALLLVYAGYGRNSDFDVQLFDTYYVIGLKHVFFFIAAITLIINLVYYYLKTNNYPLNIALKITHTISAYLAIVLGLFLLRLSENLFNTVIYGNTASVASTLKWMVLVFVCLIIFTLTLNAINWVQAIIKKGKLKEPISIDSILDS